MSLTRKWLGPGLVAIIASIQVSRAEEGGEAVVRTLVIDRSDQQQQFEGWGASLCWWAHWAGEWSDPRLASLLDRVTDPDEGLGMTIFRYNIGGGDHPDHDHMREWGDIPGFLPDPREAYDWDADPYQRKVLLGLKARIDQPVFEAFSNSPPWWMTRSGCSAGAEDGAPNLREDMEDSFANYLTDVVQEYGTRWDVQFRTLEPFNEPMSNWWKIRNNQEGCRIPVAQQERVLAKTADHLKQKKIDWVSLSSNDASSIGEVIRAFRAYSQSTIDLVSQINTHSYHGLDARGELAALAREHDKRLWQSESGPLSVRAASSWEANMIMAERIVGDLNLLKANAWLTWQILDKHPDRWGYFRVSRDGSNLRPNRNFHMLRGFTRFIRPGDRIVNSQLPEEVLVTQSPDGRRLTAVIANRSKTARIYELSVSEGAGFETADVVAFRTSPQEESARINVAKAGSDDRMDVTAEPLSVTTLHYRWQD